MPLIPFYDDPSFDYKKYWQKRRYEEQADCMALKRLLNLISQKESLIDIGAGFGRLSHTYASKFEKCVLLDPSQRMLAEAKKKFKTKKFKFIKAYIEKLPFKKEVFDVALLIRVIHHLKNPSLAIQEASRVLKPNGYLILEFANKLHFKARIRAFLGLNFDYLSNIKPIEVGTHKDCEVPFLNYHSDYIVNLLEKNNFQAVKKLSVSNFRSSIFKKIMPLKTLVLMEKFTQILLAPFNSGPSIFILARKI